MFCFVALLEENNTRVLKLWGEVSIFKKEKAGHSPVYQYKSLDTLDLCVRKCINIPKR